MLFLFSIVAFAIILAPPGDFLSDYVAQLAQQGEASALDLEALRRQYGLDQPVVAQYGKWIWGVLRWDLGMSLEWRKPVTDMVNERLVLSVSLGLAIILFTWLLAIPIGIISAVRQYSILDYIATLFSYIGLATPNFMIALVIMWVAFAYFGFNLGGLFSREYVDASWTFERVVDLLKHIWVPIIIAGMDGMARLTRIVRANLLDELNKPYVEAARAKGLPEWRVIVKYPTRIALNPFISTAGWSLPSLFGGNLILGTVMGLPILGPLLLRALISQDMFLAGDVLLILTALTLLGTLLSDILLALLDPRVRMAG